MIIAWDDTKTDNVDKVLADDWNNMVTDQKTRAKITTGSGTPTATSSTPSSIGDIYIDTNKKKIYIATGTSSPSDYKKVLSE